MADRAFSRLETPRLHIRRFRPNDLDAFQAYRSDPEVARYQSWDAPFPRDEVVAFLAEMERSHPDTPGAWFQFAVARRDDDRLIGDAALRVDDNEPDEAEIGYSLARDAMGQGYAGEAVAAVLDYALLSRSKSHVIAWADTRNTRSLALLERLGFVQQDHVSRESWFKGAWSEESKHVMIAAAWRERSAEPDA
jgi:RimJ/RimL family protein N-acetyltransferase